MKNSSDYYIVDKKVLPEVFMKVIEVKELLSSQSVTSVQEACEIAQVSRSAYYKYKDYISPLGDNDRGHTVIIAFNLQDEAGHLSNVLNILADNGANVLTINQTIPINGIANVTVSIETSHLELGIDSLLDKIKKLKGVMALKIIARE
ncbi:MAG: ACT domain-containing protein [Lachnospirales bacterium]